jgi:hypothetical protein
VSKIGSKKRISCKEFVAIVFICFLGAHVNAEDDVIIKNVSFEEKGNLVANWGIWPKALENDRSIRLVQDACDGVLAVEIKSAVTRLSESQDFGNQWIVQNCKLPVKTEFVLRVYAKGSGKGQMHLRFLDDQNQTVDKPTIVFQVQTEYQPYDLRVQCPSGATKMRVHLGALAPSSVIIFDNLKVLDVTASSNQ